jgi:hypothetical protein
MRGASDRTSPELPSISAILLPALVALELNSLEERIELRTAADRERGSKGMNTPVARRTRRRSPQQPPRVALELS